MLVKLINWEKTEVYIETKAISYITKQDKDYFVNVKGEMIQLDSKNGKKLIDIIQRRKEYDSRIEE